MKEIAPLPSHLSVTVTRWSSAFPFPIRPETVHGNERPVTGTATVTVTE
jgi:hypothetical protein